MGQWMYSNERIVRISGPRIQGHSDHALIVNEIPSLPMNISIFFFNMLNYIENLSSKYHSFLKSIKYVKCLLLKLLVMYSNCENL